MEVTLAVLADYANITQEGKLNIMGVFGEVNPPSLPFALPTLFIVIGFRASPSEVGAEKDVQIILMSEDGRSLFNISSKLTVPAPIRAGNPTYIQTMVAMHGRSFEQAGQYQFAIQVNGEEKQTIPLRVNVPQVED